jgi:hypothetical protein
MSDGHPCRRCDAVLPSGKDLSMHSRIVHSPDALYLYHDAPRGDE